MATGAPTYKGSGISFDVGPGNSLVAGQKAVGDSLKEVLGGVQNLFNQHKEAVVEENTLNMQNYLQSKIKEQGLGADPINEVGIKQKFGDMINMEQLKATEETTKKEMLTDALDTANSLAGSTFAETEDMAAAGNVYQQHLQSLGMGATEANKHMQDFRAQNQYKIEDIKLRNEQLLDTGVNDMISMFREGKADTFEEARAEIIKNTPGKLTAAMETKLRDSYNKFSELSPEAQAEYNSNSVILDGMRDSAIQQSQQKVISAENALAATEDIPATAYSGAEKLASQTGGVLEGIALDSDNGFFGGMVRGAAGLFSPGELDGYDLAEYIQTQTNDLTRQYDIDPSDAAVIAYQAYQDVKAANSNDRIGTVVFEKDLNDAMTFYANRHEQKKAQISNLALLKKGAIKEQGLIMKEAEKRKMKMLKGETLEAISGKTFDSERLIRDDFTSNIQGAGGTGNTNNDTKPDQKGDDGSNLNAFQSMKEKARLKKVANEAYARSGEFKNIPDPRIDFYEGLRKIEKREAKESDILDKSEGVAKKITERLEGKPAATINAWEQRAREDGMDEVLIQNILKRLEPEQEPEKDNQTKANELTKEFMKYGR